MEENKLTFTGKQPITMSNIFWLFMFIVVTWFVLKQCFDVKTIHQVKEATTATREAYRIYSNVRFGWTVFDKVQQFSKKKDLTKEETKQAETAKSAESVKETEQKDDKWQNKKRSGKNEKHKNQDEKGSLQKQIDELEQQLNEMEKSKPENRYKGFKKDKQEIERKIKNIQIKIKQQGETHSRTGKGFK